MEESCTDSLQVLAGLSSETFPTSTDGSCNCSNIEVEEDIVVIEEGFIPVNEVAPIGIKQEEIPEDITEPTIIFIILFFPAWYLNTL